MTVSDSVAAASVSGPQTSDGGSLPQGYESVPHSEVRLTPRRRAIARNLTVSAQIPTLTADVEVDLTAMLEVRQEWNGSDASRTGRLSVLPFIARAAVSTLAEHPDLNASLTDTALIRWSTVNLGVAVDSTGGLVVPVIRDAGSLNAEQLGAAIAALAERVRARTIRLPDLQEGTFTLSNPGAVGPSLRAEALLNPPQVGLLGLPGMRRQPLAVTGDGGEEQIQIRSVLRPSLTFDHRALDGAEAIRFLVDLKHKLETWILADYMRSP